MKALDTLIRLRQQALDSRRQELGALQARRAGVDQDRSVLETNLRREQTLAADHPELLHGYDGFARGVIARRGQLDQLAAELDQEIDAAIGQVRLAFAELRKFEIVRDRRLEEEREEREHAEQVAIDDLTITRLHHRTLRSGR